MMDAIDYRVEAGEDTGRSVVVYALTTCGFCSRALSYLKDKKIQFRYVYIDTLPLEVKKKLKDDLRSKFQRSLVFPFLVVDDSVGLTGFVKERWDEALGLPN